MDKEKSKEMNTFYREALNEALGNHDREIQQSDAPDHVKNALLGVDVGNVSSGVQTFCNDWMSAGKDLRAYARWPFVGKYISKIYALWMTADKFIVHEVCASMISGVTTGEPGVEEVTLGQQPAEKVNKNFNR